MPKSSLQNVTKSHSVQKKLRKCKGEKGEINCREFYHLFGDVLLNQKENFKRKDITMYNWAEKKSSPKNSPNQGSVQKNLHLRTGSSRLSNVTKLPVIIEEEGNEGNEGNTSEYETELRNVLYLNSKTKKNGNSQRVLEPFSKEESVSKVHKNHKTSKHSTKFPPLLNINCMMNAEIKQSKPVWDTNYGKRLITRKENVEITPPSPRLPQSSSSDKQSQEVSKGSEKFGDSQFMKTESSFSKKSSLTSGNIKKGGGDNDLYTQPRKQFLPKKHKRKTPKTSKENRTLPKLISDVEKKDESEDISPQAKEMESRLGEYQNLPSIQEEQEYQLISETPSSFSRNQHFLTECVKSILDSVSTHISCEFCEKTFANIEELFDHKKKHEAEKQICLLCGKVFYKGNEFMRHLLTHEGVDKFSCKKCRKYFPNLKKYKQHCKEFHLTPSNFSVENYLGNQQTTKFLKQKSSSSCKKEIQSDKIQQKQKKVKMDLTPVW